jgi:hypothetical protein
MLRRLQRQLILLKWQLKQQKQQLRQQRRESRQSTARLSRLENQEVQDWLWMHSYVGTVSTDVDRRLAIQQERIHALNTIVMHQHQLMSEMQRQFHTLLMQQQALENLLG